jgi:hypothetical protein
MVFFYGSFQERMPLYKYLQNRHRQNKLHRSQYKKENQFQNGLNRHCCYNSAFFRRHLHNASRKQCQSETNVSGSIVEYV